MGGFCEGFLQLCGCVGAVHARREVVGANVS